MKEKIAVSVIVILILASFCLAEAQQTAKTMPRIGFIFSSGTPGDPSPLFDAFQQGLRDLGYVEGKNIVDRTPLCGGQVGSDASVRATSLCSRKSMSLSELIMS